MKPFGDRLAEAVRRVGNPVVVGLDPRWQELPDAIKAMAGPLADGLLPSQAGRAIAASYVLFCRDVIDVVATRVAAVKPQVAFFEQLGPAGMVALGDVIRHAHARGLLVIADAKRHDIGTTAEAYADGWLGPDSPWGGDALTIGPYLGDDSLTPFVTAAEARGAGLFVLVKTSNPGGGQFQDLQADNQPVYRHVAAHVEKLAAQSVGEGGYGSVGAVVGATYPAQLAELREAMPHSWILVPGYGSQGGTAKDVKPAFDQNGLGAVVNNSRGIIFAYKRKEYAERFAADQWQHAVAAATDDMISQLRAEGICAAPQ